MIDVLQTPSRRSWSQALGCVLLVLVSTLVLVPEVEAACPGTFPTGTAVELVDCTEAASGNSNVSSVNLAVPNPGSVAANDYLVAVVITANDETFSSPPGWFLLGSLNNGTDVELAVYNRTSDGAEPASYTFSWGSNEEYYAFMMHFTGTSGIDQVAVNTGTSASPTAPSVTTTSANNLILRLGAFDDDDIVINPGTIMAGHTNITQNESSSTFGNASGAGAYTNQAGIGAAGTGSFSLTASEQWVTATLSLPPGTPPPPPFLCPGVDGTIFGSQLVVLEECTETKVGSNQNSITIATPATAAEGQLLIAVITTDGNETIAEPAGWGVLDETTNSGMTFSVYFKFATASEPANHTWTIGSNEQIYGYMMSFSGASGNGVFNFQSSPADNNTPIAPSVNTLVDDTLVVRVSGHDDDDLVTDPAIIVAGQNNITADSSNAGTGTVSSQAVYLNQPAAGATGTVNFSLTANEEWRAGTMGLDPLEFRFSHSGTMSLCSVEEVTLRVTDRNNSPVTSFVGTVTLGTSGVAGGNGDWAIGTTPDPGQGTLVNSVGGTGNGQATYQFVAADNGEVTLEFTTGTVGALSFDLDYLGRFSESVDPALIIDNNCEFQISHDGTAGTCGPESVTFTLVDSSGLQGENYTGTMDVTLNLGTGGNFTVVSGGGALVPDPDNDDNGAASYTFVAGDLGQVVLGYSTSTAQTVNFNAVDATNGYVTDTDLPAANDPNLVVGNCEVEITLGSPTSDVCSRATVTFTITDPGGAPVTNFAGTINVNADSLTGTWHDIDGTNLVNDATPGDGQASYTFDPLDNGSVNLGFNQLSTNPGVNFDATGTGLTVDPLADPDLQIDPCTAEINVNATTNVCSPSETITVTIRNSLGNIATDFDGTVVIATSTTNGDYISTTGAGTLDNGAADDGIATYDFSVSDGGTVDIQFSNNNVETLDFSVSSTFITFDAGSSNENLQILACEFRISHSGNTDVCSVESVTISVFNSAGAAVTDYVGTVNLATSTGNGSWANDTGNGPVTDPVTEDGSATYEFVGADNGTVDLFFTDATAETVNINISDGVTTDSNSTFDPNLNVAACTFRITMVDATMTACTSENITVTVFDSNSVIATGYTGTVNISTDTLNGNWADAGALNGVLTDTTPDDGVATYQFNATDNGTATFTFTSLTVETVNVNLVDGSIVEDGAFDPDLNVTGCIPTISNFQCFPGSSGGTGSLAIGGANPGRMVAMLIFHVDGTPQDVTTATFNGVNMTQIHEIASTNTAVEMWGILDADLPGSAGSYPGAYNFDAPPANTASMCMVEFTDVEQAFPATGTPANEGQVNGNAFTDTSAPNEMATTIRTLENNAIILSGGVTDFNPGGNSWFNDVEPDPPMTQLFFNNNDARPVGGTAGGSSGTKPAAGSITVIDIDTQAANSSSAHIVAAFNPRVAGDPEAEGFVPVLLFDTLAGNQNYRAIGSTLRTASNNSGGACSFYPVGTGSTADLVLPAGSTVEKAFLYWAGSGEDFEADFDVDFGVDGAQSSITADLTYLIDNVGGGGNLDYFAGYKDVTFLVSGSATYRLSNLTVQNNPPWSSTQACAGGWGMVVVYSNTEERFRVTNVYQGFQPFQNNNFTLVPRNFRMATADVTNNLPNGQITHFTIEGDETLATGDESLGIQDGPGLETFTTLSNSFNPLTADFNSTVTRPIWAFDVGTGFQEFQATAGLNGDGYEIDQPGPDAVELGRTGVEIGASWGFDVDTHYVEGSDPSGVLWNFAQPGAEAEEITTRYSAGQDLVMLIAEVFSVTNFDLADLEIFKSELGDFKVNGTGQYLFTVTNNGNGGVSGGEATGQVVVADVLPAGLTLASVSGTDWNCPVTSANAFTCVFDIAADCDAASGCVTTPGQLESGESLATITANINVGDASFFPLLSNNVKNVGRMQHNGGSCSPLVAGVIPDPDTCARSPQFDFVNNLQGGAIDINDLDDKEPDQNNVHSIITEVRGVETDLGITKAVNGILEAGSTGSYTITVTNFGPDDTTGGAGGTITVTDIEPAGVTFDNASGTGWSCSLGPFNCTYAGVLPVGNSAVITLDVTVTGSAGQNVTNTAAVSSGTFNFDSNSGNDADTDVTAIVAPPVSSNEKFLLSVSVPGNSTQIGGLAAFENDDYIEYDPLTDNGFLFYDNSGEGFGVNDADAVHLFKNGHIAMSAAASSTMGSNTLAFEPEDIVVWDPILGTATLLFDGSAVFDGPIGSNENIDAVYVKDNGRILFSTAGPAGITFTGPTTVNFNEGDIVEYNPADGSAVILVDASDPEIFNGEVQVDGIYLRVDDNDADLNKDVYVLTVNETSATIGACGSCDPAVGTVLSRDDIVELDLTGADPVTQNLFVGDVPLGVFTPVDNNRTVDAIHVIEDGYIGHFAVSQSQAGSTCAAGQITIRKHKGLTHNVDTGYAGSILITTDIGQGDWSIAVGNGALDNGVADDGAATYTFVPADNGEVTLFLAEDTAGTINVNVTNHFPGFVGELGSEDPNFTFNNIITNVTYRDEWSAVDFGNNDGSTFWAGDWIELDGVSAGPAAGNIRVNAGQLEITSTVGDPTPSLSRQADLSLFNVTETVFLNFDYSYQFLNSGSDVLVVQARANSGDAFTAVQTFSGIGGTNLTPTSVNLDLTSLLGSPLWTSTTEIRIAITSGFTGTSRMFFDNIELATGTTDCGVGSIQHYEVRVDGVTGPFSTQVNGLQCVGSVVTLTGHDLNHFPSASAESITLQTSTGKGDWTLLAGTGSFNNGTLGDGIATYTFSPVEQAASFLFNYTDPLTDPELVNINMASAFGISTQEDPTLAVQQAGLLFYNETADAAVNIAPIPTQIAGKPSTVAPDLRLITIEAVRTSDEDPLACSPLFDAGNILSIGFAAECLDPGTCSASLSDQFAVNGTVMTPAPDNSGAGTSASHTPINILMVDQGGGHVGGELEFTYTDAGQIEVHAQYELPLNNDPGGTPSGDFISGSSLPFIVRPFGFDVDFSGDRAGNGLGGTSYSADADGTVFATAGVQFDTTVSAIAWQQVDDLAPTDGIPDDGAALYDNPVTPNYGNESTASGYDVLVTLNQVAAPPSGVGSINDNLFPTFSNGAQTKSMMFDEVGIIDLDVQLVDSSDGMTPIDFMNTGVGLQGNVRNVGRFIPAEFVLSNGMIAPRSLANNQISCINQMSNFTYMGEEFGISADVTSYNGEVSPQITRNYVGSFAKLDNLDFTFDRFFAIEELPGVDNDLSSRMADPTVGASRTIAWNSDPMVDGGEGLLLGNLVFSRQASLAEDGPYEDLIIGLATTDSDSVPFTLDLDIDDAGGNDVATLDTEEFRYGRLLIDNAFGPELEPLGIPFRVEYFNGTDFVLNRDDSCTTLFFNQDSPPSAITFLSDAGSFTENLDDGETVIESGVDVELGLFLGQTGLQASGADQDVDRPLETSAPGEGNEGSVVIEFDLNHASLPFSLEFLAYDWRTAGELENDTQDGDYTDNPRSRLEFGSYRAHDRVINWQEILN